MARLSLLREAEPWAHLSAGGGTIVVMEVRCALSSPKTSSC